MSFLDERCSCGGWLTLIPYDGGIGCAIACLDCNKIPTRYHPDRWKKNETKSEGEK